MNDLIHRVSDIDGHVYTRLPGGMIGHLFCYCFENINVNQNKEMPMGPTSRTKRPSGKTMNKKGSAPAKKGGKKK